MRRRTSSSRSGWKTGWVITSSAPAAFLRSRRRISLSRSAAPGSTPVARRNDVWPPRKGLPAGSMPRFMLRRHLEQADRVEVVDGGGLGVVADLRRIAGDDDEVADADGVRAEQVRHLAEQVPVAPADVEDRLDPVALEQQGAEREVRHARHGARPVGDVDDVDAAVEQHLRPLQGLRRVETRRGVHLDRDDELAGRDLGREGAPLGERRRLEDGHDLRGRDGARRGRPPCAAPSMRPDFAIQRTCSGVVPQQPPIIVAPGWIMRRANTSKYSGVAM